MGLAHEGVRPRRRELRAHALERGAQDGGELMHAFGRYALALEEVGVLADASEARVHGGGELCIDLVTLLRRLAHLWGEGSKRHCEHVHAWRPLGGFTLRPAPLLAPCWAPPDLRDGEAMGAVVGSLVGAVVGSCCCCCATSALLSAALGSGAVLGIGAVLGRGAAAANAPCARGVVVGGGVVVGAERTA
jgi:hypothetical protein